MAYVETKIGLLIRVNPRAAREVILNAFAAVADDETPGRVVEKAATHLGVSSATLKRFLSKLEDADMAVEYEKKRENRD